MARSRLAPRHRFASLFIATSGFSSGPLAMLALATQPEPGVSVGLGPAAWVVIVVLAGVTATYGWVGLWIAVGELLLQSWERIEREEDAG